jgi:hypothetical protein
MTITTEFSVPDSVFVLNGQVRQGEVAEVKVSSSANKQIVTYMVKIGENDYALVDENRIGKTKEELLKKL